MLANRSFAYSHAGIAVIVELQDHGLLLTCRGIERAARYLLIPECQYGNYLGLLHQGLGSY